MAMDRETLKVPQTQNTRIAWGLVEMPDIKSGEEEKGSWSCVRQTFWANSTKETNVC